MMCELETDRLILREYVMEDFDAPFDEEKTRKWIQWNLDNYKKYGFGLWAVVLKETELILSKLSQLKSRNTH